MCCSPDIVRVFKINEEKQEKEFSMHGRVQKHVQYLGKFNLNEETLYETWT
jgi:hypothetical protein